MKTRILAGAALLCTLLALLLWAPGWLVTVVVGIMAAVGSYELLYRTGLQKNARLNVYSAVMAFLVSLWSGFGCSYAWALVGILLYYALLFGEMMASKLRLQFKDAMVCMLSGVIMPFLLTALVRILCMEHGRILVYIPFVMAFLSDTGAYFVGVTCGKHKMAPVISPKKSWEGFFGGIAAAILGMVAYALLLDHGFGQEVNYWAAVLYGLVGALAGVFGDLTLSVVKRQVGLKDYGNLIPGHGGILDRFDSVMVTAPLTEALLLLLPILVK